MKVNLEDLLKQSFDEEIARMPKQHSQRTDACPHMSLYGKYAKEGWPEELKEHARTCQYCKKSLAATWSAMEMHPSEAELNDENNINRIAIERHLNWHGCKSCAEKLKEGVKE